MKIGQRVYLLNISYNKIKRGEITECIVKKAGSKYIFVHYENQDLKFYTDNGRQVADYYSEYILFETKEAAEIIIKKKRLISKIRSQIDNGKLDFLSIDNLNLLLNILDNELLH